jgi:hypothetical protein
MVTGESVYGEKRVSVQVPLSFGLHAAVWSKRLGSAVCLF